MSFWWVAVENQWDLGWIPEEKKVVVYLECCKIPYPENHVLELYILDLWVTTTEMILGLKGPISIPCKKITPLKGVTNKKSQLHPVGSWDSDSIIFGMWRWVVGLDTVSHAWRGVLPQPDL